MDRVHAEDEGFGLRSWQGVRSLGAVIVAVGVGVIAGAPSASAETLKVTNTDDSGAGSFRDAVELADADPAPDAIKVKTTGTVSTLSTISINSSIDIDGPGASKFVLDGGLLHPPLRISGQYSDKAAVNVKLEGLTVARGSSNTLAIDSSTARLDGVVVRDGFHDAVCGSSCSIFSSGAGLSIYYSFVTLVRSTVRDNTLSVSGGTASGSGGGIDNIGGQLKILRSTISGNRVETDAPGTSSEAKGAGISSQNYNPDIANVTMRASTVANNTAKALSGGTSSGGGILVDSSTFSGPGTDSGSFDVFSSTVFGNAAGSGANLLYADEDVEAISIQNSAFGGAGSATGCEGFIGSGGFNVDDDGTCSGPSLSDETVADLKLGALAKNGGPTETLLPKVKSPLVDAGFKAGRKDQRGKKRRVDLPKVKNKKGSDKSDVGAVELQP